MRGCVSASRKPVNEVIRRPGARELHLALAHHGAGSCVFILVPLNAFAINQMGDIEHHLAAFREPAAHFFVKRGEHAVHLEADSPGSGLALSLTGGVLAKIREILLANPFQRQMLVQFAAAVIDHDFQVHLSLTVQTFEITLELALIGADGFTQPFVILKNSSKTEGQYSGLFEAVSNNPCVIDSGLMVESVCRIVFANDDGEVTGGVEEDLVATDSKYGFEWDRFAMAG
jgi:hypothetical protein